MNSREQSNDLSTLYYNLSLHGLFRELLAQIHVMPDNPSDRFKRLPTTSRLKNRAKVKIFCNIIYCVHIVITKD